MPRAATTSDVFNAVAEDKRRQIIDLLTNGREWSVGEIVVNLGLPQPTVSKHLGVLRTVGLVEVRKDGQSRLYRLNAARIKPVYDWAKTFEQHWTTQLDRIKARAERSAAVAKETKQPVTPAKEKL